MLTSAFVLITLLPLQASPGAKQPIALNKPLAVGAFVDSARILGFPKFKLRDGNGNPYLPEKTLLQEPLANIQDSAGVTPIVEINKRKAYIASNVRR
jgi:hypothetical protein